MISKLHKPKKTSTGRSQNTGSCVKLADYLDKEKGDGKCFFSHCEDSVSLIEVVDRIDKNKRTLKDKQDKYYMLSYNPSAYEISHLIKISTGKSVNDLSELTSLEREKVFNEFREYIRGCMDVYAKNFNRSKELSAKDLVYFGRIESERHYTHNDEAVKLGLKKRGEVKEGFNLHAHVIVSRMDTTQKISLSPNSQSRGNKNQLNGKLVNNGFNLKKWQGECYELFGNKYRYISSTEERFYHKNNQYQDLRFTVQNRILDEITTEMKEEKRLARSISGVILTRSPKAIVRGYIKNKMKEILSEQNNEM